MCWITTRPPLAYRSTAGSRAERWAAEILKAGGGPPRSGHSRLFRLMPFGKAQRLLAELGGRLRSSKRSAAVETCRPLMAHLPNPGKFVLQPDGDPLVSCQRSESLQPAGVATRPQPHTSVWMKRFKGRPRRAFVKRLDAVYVAPERRAGGYERGFTLSDHADLERPCCAACAIRRPPGVM